MSNNKLPVALFLLRRHDMLGARVRSRAERA
jgi:hypothetical protein